MSGEMETVAASRTDERLGNLYSMLSTDPVQDLTQQQVARSTDLGSRLGSLDAQFSKQQSDEAERFKTLRMVLDKMDDDLGIESISLDTLKDRYDQEIKSLESAAVLDLGVHRQSRRDLDTSLSKKMDQKFNVFRQELMEEKQRRMDSARRSNMDPSILPNLVSKCEQEGSLRRDRGEQVLDKIRARTLSLHNMLSVEDGAHGSIEDFTQNIVGKSKSLRGDIAREKDARVVTEGRHGQRVMTLRELAADVADDRKKRARKREQMFVKVKEEMDDTLKYIQTETQARLDSEEYYNRMMDDSTNKMQAEITKECNERELSEQHFFGLLEETVARVKTKM
jgi:hypothetical protein